MFRNSPETSRIQSNSASKIGKIPTLWAAIAPKKPVREAFLPIDIIPASKYPHLLD
jgi:hypothetical protein